MIGFIERRTPSVSFRVPNVLLIMRWSPALWSKTLCRKPHLVIILCNRPALLFHFSPKHDDIEDLSHLHPDKGNFAQLRKLLASTAILHTVHLKIALEKELWCMWFPGRLHLFFLLFFCFKYRASHWTVTELRTRDLRFFFPLSHCSF